MYLYIPSVVIFTLILVTDYHEHKSVIIGQLTPGEGKLMESKCIRIYNGQILRNWNFGSTWVPPGVSVGCTGTPAPKLLLLRAYK